MYRYLVWLFVLLCACDSDSAPDDIEISYLTIASYKGLLGNWAGVSDREAYIFTEDGGNAPKTAVSISGFDEIYEKGYEYVIKVKAEPVVDTGGEYWQDAYGEKYTLLEIVSKVKKDYEEFVYVVEPAKTFFKNWLGKTEIPAYAILTEFGAQETILSISGFDEVYEAGYRYEIRAKAVPNEDLEPQCWPDNYGGFDYSLIEIIDKRES